MLRSNKLQGSVSLLEQAGVQQPRTWLMNTILEIEEMKKVYKECAKFHDSLWEAEAGGEQVGGRPGQFSLLR